MLFRLALLALLCLISAADLTAQVNERAFALEVALHQGGRRLTGAGLDFRTLELQDSIEGGRGGYSVGLLFESRAGKLGFTSGVRYLRTGFTVTDNGTDGAGFGTDVNDEITAEYVEIPFELNFHQDITPKDRVGFTFGLSANVHLRTVTRRITTIEGVAGLEEEVPDNFGADFRRVVPAFTTGLIYDRRLGERWAVKVQPFFRYFLRGNLAEEFNVFNRNYYQTGVRATVKRFF